MNAKDLIKLITPTDAIANDVWAANVSIRASMVTQYRRYHDGTNDARLTDEMKKALRIETGAEFGVNYCQKVINTLSDRLTLTGVSSSDAKSTEWASAVLDANRIDGLQISVHDSALIDAITYVFVDWDNDKQQVRLTHEQAFNGTEGIIPVWARTDRRRLAAAIKVWQTINSEGESVSRFNIYYRNYIAKFEATGTSFKDATLLDKVDWLMSDGSPIGIPLVPFIHNARGATANALSELSQIVPLQEVLDRTVYSMIVATELTAFRIGKAKFFDPPSAITPGGYIKIPVPMTQAGKPATIPNNLTPDLEFVDGADLSGYVDQCRYIVSLIHDISNTPENNAGASASGEALKQREVALLAKVRRSTIQFGNSWESVIQLATVVANAFGTRKPSMANIWRAQWKDAQIRNDADMVRMILDLRDIIGDKEVLRQVIRLGTLEYTEEDVDRIIAERNAELAQTLAPLNPFNVPDSQIA